jgi:hypothetical protein
LLQLSQGSARFDAKLEDATSLHITLRGQRWQIVEGLVRAKSGHMTTRSSKIDPFQAPVDAIDIW